MKAHQVVVIVTSAGGPPSLYEIISKFSEKFYAGVIVAQHLPSNFLDSFTSHIQKMTSMQVKIADKGDLLFSRRILFSPTNATLELHQTKKGALVDIVDHKTRLQPDIDKVIISCANVFKSATTLVVLSGLGSDGVKGAEVVKKYGGKVIVEDKATAGIYVGMPLSVVKSGFYDTTCPSYGIAEMIENILSNKTNAVAPKNSLVKGIVLRAIVSFLRTKCAPEDYSSVMDALSEASRNALTNSLNAYNYYPLEIYYEITDTINKSCSEKNKNIIDDLAMSIVQECYFMYKQGFPVANPENFISFIPTFQKVIFPGDSWEVLSISNDQKRAELIDHNDTFNDNNIQLFAKMTCGWLKHLFVLAGFSSRDCRVEQGADQKGQFIKCTVSWN